MSPAAVAALALVLANLVLIVLLFCRRWWAVRSQRRHRQFVEQLRRPAVVLIESDSPDEPPDLHGAEKKVFAELLADYARRLRGPSRQRIVAYFEASGAIDEQIVQLRHRRAWRRASAAFTLGDMGSVRAVTDLLRALDDRARDVRMAATRSLGRVRAVEAIGPIVAAGVGGRVPRDVANLALLDIGPSAVPQLLELTTHPDPSIRSSSLELIGLLGTAGNAEPLVDHLADPAAAVRVAAAGALGRVGAREAQDALVRALDDRVPPVRAAAARALGEIGGRQAAEALLPLASSENFDVARAAAEALARIDPALVIRSAAEPGAGEHLHEAADRVAL
jgi:HEAT repeat protein